MQPEEISYTNFEASDLKRYCIKTGKELLPVTFNEVINLIKIHGEERAKLVICKLQQSIALEWVLTDSKALNKLALHQPVEYFIYTLSAILTKPKPDSTLEVLNDFRLKIEVNKYLHNEIDNELILNLAELTRRVLASNRPVAIQEMLNNINMGDICKSFDSLVKFQLTLQGCLKQITFGYYDDTLVNDRQRQRKELFYKQKQLVALTELEQEIGLSLNDFDIIIDQDTELQKLVKKTKKSIVRTKLKDTALKDYQRKIDNDKVSLNSFKIKNSFVGIKFAGSKKS